MALKSIKINMRIILVVLAFALTSNFVYAQRDNEVAVTINADVSITPSSVFSATTLKYPTIYNDFTGTITTSDTSLVPGGTNGSVSTVTIHTSAHMRYTVTVGNMDFVNNGQHYTGYCTLPDGNSRQTNSSGDDHFTIAGSMSIDPAMSQLGSFNATAVITFSSL